MAARIYKPTKNAMQSGKAKTKDWLLEFIPENSRSIDPLMGWTSSNDTKQQLKLKFHSAEDAVKYATSHNIEYIVIEPKKAKLIKQAYAENFI